MKLLKPARYAIPVFIVITIVLFVLLISLITRVSEVRNEGEELVFIAGEIRHINDSLVKSMRLYVYNQERETLHFYEDYLDELDEMIGEMEKKDLSSTEQNIYSRMLNLLDRLEALEITAFDALDRGDNEAARAVVFGSEYSGLDLELSVYADDLLNSISERVNEEAASLTAQGTAFLAVLAIFVISILIAIMLFVNWVIRKLYWYEDILDHIPMPISVTDVHRKTTFINKPVESFLKTTRDEAIGRPCKEVWKAPICGNERCGINCLEHGVSSTAFEVGGKDFKVDASFLFDSKNRKVGHIEVVSDMTEIFKSQREEAELVRGIEQISHTFVMSSKQIADGSQLLAQNSTEQAATIEQLSSSVSEITGKIVTSADMADKAANLANIIKGNAEKGSHQMAEMIRAVGDINDASQQIGQVIKTIDNIAFQTNILALNASVEAARAGQHGKGFAVVAEEVRNLASKSAEAASDTGAMIENSIQKAELGKRIAGETAASLEEIVVGINESSQLIFEIAKSSSEQSSGVSQIDSGIEQVAQLVQQTSATAQQSAASSSEMSGEAEHLEQLLYNFKSKSGGAQAPPRERQPSNQYDSSGVTGISLTGSDKY